MAREKAVIVQAKRIEYPNISFFVFEKNKDTVDKKQIFPKIVRLAKFNDQNWKKPEYKSAILANRDIQKRFLEITINTKKNE